MTMAEELRQEGHAKGRLEGLRSGLVRTLEKQLVLKFGELSAAHAARIEAASDEQLERALERILTADTIEAVLAEG